MNLYFPRKIIRKLPGIVIKAVPLPNPVLTTGFGMREKVGEICRSRGYKSVLLVTDRTLCSLGFHDKVLASLKEKCIACSVFSDIASEPDADIISRGREAAKNCGAECIIALGGGSVMDSCKVIAASAVNYRRPLGRFLTKFVFIKGGTLPLITIPSTAGTGAEITVGAVVKNKKGTKKSSVVVGLNVTDVILDSELTCSAPKRITVSCGIDALSHGLEGFLADIKSNEADIEKSRECVRLVIENLPKVIENPRNEEARGNLCLAAYYGGNAINKQLAGYIHAFAHTIGGYYHIPHGEAIAKCLLPITDYHRDICRDKLFSLSVYCGIADENEDEDSAVQKLLDALAGLLKLCVLDGGCEAIDKKDYNSLVGGINADSINYSPPKTLKNSEIVKLLDIIGKGEK